MQELCLRKLRNVLNVSGCKELVLGQKLLKISKVKRTTTSMS